MEGGSLSRSTAQPLSHSALVVLWLCFSSSACALSPQPLSPSAAQSIRPPGRCPRARAFSSPVMPQTRSGASSEFNAQVRAEGSKIYEFWVQKDPKSCFAKFTQEEIDKVGGQEGFVGIFQTFYSKVLADPVMKVLFDPENPDSIVPAEEHGKRLGSYLLQTHGPEQYATVYRNLRSLESEDQELELLMEAHHRAIACPMRPKEQTGKNFTVKQRDTWLGYHSLAMDENQVPAEFKTKVLQILTGFHMPNVGQFADV